MEIIEIDFHRNGVSGESFYAVLFKYKANKGEETFLASVFEESGYCSVISLDRIEKYGIRFGNNSWRGDHFETDLRKAIEEYRKKLYEKIENYNK